VGSYECLELGGVFLEDFCAGVWVCVFPLFLGSLIGFVLFRSFFVFWIFFGWGGGVVYIFWFIIAFIF